MGRKIMVNLGRFGGRVEMEDGGYLNLDEEEYYYGGERLTEARAEAIAREISRRHGVRGGRPALAAEQRVSVQKAVRLTPDRARRLAEAAKSRGLPESVVIREALDAYLKAS